MAPNMGDARRGARSDRLDTIGWGALLVSMGVVWLVAAGAVLLGSCVARAAMGLGIHDLAMATGTVALVLGVSGAAGLAEAAWPAALIALGLLIAASALIRARRPGDPRLTPVDLGGGAR